MDNPIHQLSRQLRLRTLPLGLFLFGSAVAGCSGSEVSIGSGQQPVEVPEGLCGDGTWQGNVVAGRQEQIEALRGCTEITGDLTLRPFAEMDLTPLSELRIVRGDLEVGEASPGVDVSGRMTSLAGLESLEQVNSLSLRGVMASDLSALANLRRINVDPLGPHTDGGMFEIFSCDELVDLGGLDALADFADISVSGNARLNSLSGPHFPPRMRRISLAGGVLTDLSALGAVRTVDTFEVQQNTSIQHLDGLALENVGVLALIMNDGLQQVDSLSSLESLENFLVARNPRLERLPSLDGVDFVKMVTVVDNAELRNVPTFSGGLGESFWLGAYRSSGADFGPEFASFDVFDVGDNPKLARIDA
ncbi:MAG TPA: hypothetical protein VMG12_20615, partial [Polyangiaceae bacterium]|nr:hypothetical protein [Polyangiaceae bacterium]